MIRASMRDSRDCKSVSATQMKRSRVLPALLAFVAGCTLVVDSEQTQCEVDADCQDRFGTDRQWSCQENVCFAATNMMSTTTEPEEWACLDTPAEISPEPGPFTVTVHVQNIANSSMPIAGAKVDLCAKLDPNCATPDATMIADANGDVSFKVRKGYSGFVAITKEGFVETDYHFPTAINRDEMFPGIQLAPPGIVAALTSGLSVAQSPERGVVLVSMFNCKNAGAPGVQFSAKEADAATRAFYAAGSLPSATLTETEVSGFGGFINAPLGIFTIEVNRVADGRLLSRSAISVKKNALTITRMVPMKL